MPLFNQLKNSLQEAIEYEQGNKAKASKVRNIGVEAKPVYKFNPRIKKKKNTVVELRKLKTSKT